MGLMLGSMLPNLKCPCNSSIDRTRILHESKNLLQCDQTPWMPCESSHLLYSFKSATLHNHLFLNQAVYLLIRKIWNLLPQNSTSNIYLPCSGLTFSLQAVKRWKSLPNEAVYSLFLEIFKTRSVKALSNQVWPCNWPCFQQEDGWYPEVPSSLNFLMIPQELKHSSKPKTD